MSEEAPAWNFLTAIDYQGADPVYYDGEIVSINRIRSSDFDGDALIGFADLFLFLDTMGATGDRREDLDGDGIVGFGDLMMLLDSLSKCVNETGSLYEVC